MANSSWPNTRTTNKRTGCRRNDNDYRRLLDKDGSSAGICQETLERLDPRLQAHFHEVLQVLQNKLQAALVKVDSVLCLKDGENYTVDSHSHQLPVKKIKTALLKSGIKQAIQDLENLQVKFDPSWYLMTLVADSTIDQHLQQRPTFYNDPTEKLKASEKQ